MPRITVRNTLINLSLLLLSTVFAIGLCEGLLRSFVRVGSFQWVSDNDLSWNQSDPERDYVLTPGFQGRLESSEFSNSIHINELGFRGPQPDENQSPVFVIGDSFVFGVGAEEDETLPARIAHHLGLSGEAREVWNLGVPSHSSPQYRRTLDHYRALSKPSLIVICLFMGRLPGDANDLWGAVTFEENQGSASEPVAVQTTEERDRLAGSPEPPKVSSTARKPFSVRSTIKWLKRRSVIYTFAASRIGPSIRAWRHRERQLIDSERDRFERGWSLIRRDLQAMSRSAEQAGADVLVVHVPESSDVINGHWDSFKRLQTLTDELNLELTDLRAVFEPSRGHELYYPIDGHLNPDGYDQVAQAVTRYLHEQQISKNSSPKSRISRISAWTQH